MLLRVVNALPPSVLRWVGRAAARRPALRRALARGTRSIRSADVTIPRGPCRGMRFNAGGATPSYALGIADPAEQDLLARVVEPGSSFYDIGASVGYFTLLGARSVGPEGRVVAFEPLPENVRTLKRNLALNGLENTTVIEAAVGEAGGRAVLALGEQPMWGRVVDQAWGRPAVETDLLAIDELVADGRIPPPEYVKVDVEGAEIGVLAGMRESIRAHRPWIMCEIHGTGPEVVPMLSGLGYTLSWVEGKGASIEDAPAWFHLAATP
jgi:FkbM family methyltransferase